LTEEGECKVCGYKFETRTKRELYNAALNHYDQEHPFEEEVLLVSEDSLIRVPQREGPKPKTEVR